MRVGRVQRRGPSPASPASPFSAHRCLVFCLFHTYTVP